MAIFNNTVTGSNAIGFGDDTERMSREISFLRNELALIEQTTRAELNSTTDYEIAIEAIGNIARKALANDSLRG